MNLRSDFLQTTAIKKKLACINGLHVSTLDSTNGVSVGAGLSVCWANSRSGFYKETSMKTVIFCTSVGLIYRFYI